MWILPDGQMILAWDFKGRRAESKMDTVQELKEKEKIKLKAVMTKDRQIRITDQHGREFDVHDPATLTRSAGSMPMEVELRLSPPHGSWSLGGPVATVRIDVPVEVEE